MNESIKATIRNLRTYSEKLEIRTYGYKVIVESDGEDVSISIDGAVAEELLNDMARQLHKTVTEQEEHACR
jgi:hypothetical protein